MVPISDDISSIRESARELNLLADKASIHIRQIDAILEEIQPGIEVEGECFERSARLKNSNGDIAKGFYTIAYDRDEDDKFALVVKAEAEITENQDGQTVKVVDDRYDEPMLEILWVRRLTKVSRTIRVRAIASLPDLIHRISEALTDTVKKTRESLEKTQAAFGEMNDLLAAAIPPVDHGKSSDNRRSAEQKDQAKQRILDHQAQNRSAMEAARALQERHGQPIDLTIGRSKKNA